MTYLLVGIGGAIGALARYAISLAALQYLGAYWPWGTLIANLAGCFLLGLLMPIIARSGDDLESVRLLAAVGILGSLTTFSTLTFEVVQLVQNKHHAAAGAYLLTTLCGGIALTIAGWSLMTRTAT